MKPFTFDRRQLLIGTQALAASAVLPGFGRRAMAQELTDMTFLTPFGFLIAFVDTMYADTGGYFEKHGLNVTINGGRGSSMAVQQVTAGNALVSRTGGSDLIKAYATDPSIVAIGDIFQRDIFYVISAQDSPVATPEDMAGKTIGVVSASGATENILDMMLAARDIPAGDVAREVAGNAPAAFELVKLGRIAAFIATSDTVFQLQVDDQPINAWSTDEVALSPGQVYMTSKAQLEQNTETIARFLAAVHEGLGFTTTADNLQAVVDSMSAKYEIFEAGRPDKGLSVLENSVRNYVAPYTDKLATNPEAWESSYRLMVKAGLIEELDDRNFHDDTARQLAFS